ncbi:MAG: hypothetical protein ACTS6G_00350 [Candidatus Hodgkinia cicadicola]
MPVCYLIAELVRSGVVVSSFYSSVIISLTSFVSSTFATVGYLNALREHEGECYISPKSLYLHLYLSISPINGWRDIKIRRCICSFSIPYFVSFHIFISFMISTIEIMLTML